MLASQVVPALFVIASIVVFENFAVAITHLLLIEIAFLLPAIIFVWYRKHKNNPHKSSEKHPALPFLCYLRALSISLILSFIVLFVAETVFSKRFGTTPLLILIALISSLLSPYLAIKQSNF